MSGRRFPRLVADIGGTSVRFAIVLGDREPEQIVRLKVADFPSLADAARHYLSQMGITDVRAGAFGIACPVTGDRVHMTNHHWDFSIRQTRDALGFEHLDVINDFVAQALAVPLLDEGDRVAVGGGSAVAGAPIGVIGAGTGLGMGLLVQCPERGYVPIPGEGGHATAAAIDDRDAAILDLLRRRLLHVSWELVVSGMGLMNIHDALAELGPDRPACRVENPADITAHQDDCPVCRETVARFCGFLGNCAGNLALTAGTFGGVVISGGIVPRLGADFADSPFRTHFEAKGRFQDYVGRIPTWVVTREDPALLGLAALLNSQEHNLPPIAD